MVVTPRLIFYNPAVPTQKYYTIRADDPNIPAGFVDSQGSDGATPEALQVFRAGVNNQGAGDAINVPVTDGDPGMRATQPAWPNGILNGYGGGLPTLNAGQYGTGIYGYGVYGIGNGF